MNTPSHDNTTSLMSASGNGHISVVQLLLDQGAAINAENDNNKTAMFFANSGNHVQVVNLLLDRGAKWPTLCNSNKFDEDDRCLLDPITLSCIDSDNGSVFINQHDLQGQYCYAAPHSIPNDPIDRNLLFQPIDVTSIVHRLLKHHKKMKM